MGINEKRSPAAESAQLCLALPGDSGGVGARQAPPPPALGGGGYLDICTSANFWKKSGPPEKNAAGRDPRLDDLRRMGLQRVWVDVAEEIGVDAFLRAWRIIDADPACSSDGTTLRVPLRLYRTFLRFQRNRFIRALADLKHSPRDIKRRLSRQFGESVSLRHIKRIASGD